MSPVERLACVTKESRICEISFPNRVSGRALRSGSFVRQDQKPVLLADLKPLFYVVPRCSQCDFRARRGARMSTGTDSQIIHSAADRMRAQRKVAPSEEIRFAGVSVPASVSGTLA